ncbi:MAG: hypothetical protein V1859_10740 [archaeon]
MQNCNICSNAFTGSPDQLVLCEHKDGMVHKGCCTSLCSMDGKPCKHGIAMYSKVV